MTTPTVPYKYTREGRTEALYWHVNEMVSNIDLIPQEAEELGLDMEPVADELALLEVSCWAVLTYLGTLKPDDAEDAGGPS